MPGVKTLETYEPKEIRGPGDFSQFLTLPCTIESGQNLDIGRVIGMRPTTGKYIAYDKDAAASATSPVAGEENTGTGTCSDISVQDDYTLTENWTLTCTAEGENSGTFSVVGSISGSVGNATVGSEFKYPNTAAYKVKFTISDGETDFAEGDTFAFSTAKAGARTAKGISTEKVDASAEDKISSLYAKGNFIESKLTGLDSDAKTHLNGKSVGDCFLM